MVSCSVETPEMRSDLAFVASMTVCPSDIRKIREHVDFAGAKVDPLAQILVTPLFVSPDSLKLVAEIAEQGKRVLFDSGGYHVQTGKLSYHELYLPLLNIYKSNPWADVYTLPDHVPLSQDSTELVDRKIHDTISFSSLFFRELPDALKPRAMPVVQGHTYRQVDACLEAYINLGVRQIGFGSFGTIGNKSEVNIATQTAVELAQYVAQVARSHGMRLHVFGLGVPALVAMIKGIGASSFDSASWLKAAGFGQVFLPFMRAYNISYRTAHSELQKGVTYEQFEEWKKLTGHSCRYCADLEGMRKHKMYRAVHNLIVISETVEMANRGDYDRIRLIYEHGSKRYKDEYRKWLDPE